MSWVIAFATSLDSIEYFIGFMLFIFLAWLICFPAGARRFLDKIHKLHSLIRVALIAILMLAAIGAFIGSYENVILHRSVLSIDEKLPP